MHSSALVSTTVTRSSCVSPSFPSSPINQSQMLLQDLWHAFLGLPIFPPIWLALDSLLYLNSRSSSLSPYLDLVLQPAISLTLCANQCLQHLPALCWLFRYLSLVSGLPWLNVALLLRRVLPLGMASLLYYELSLCPVLPDLPILDGPFLARRDGPLSGGLREPYVARLAAEPASPLFIILIHQLAVCDLIMTGDWSVFIDQPIFVQ